MAPLSIADLQGTLHEHYCAAHERARSLLLKIGLPRRQACLHRIENPGVQMDDQLRRLASTRARIADTEASIEVLLDERRNGLTALTLVVSTCAPGMIPARAPASLLWLACVPEAAEYRFKGYILPDC